MRFAQWFEAQTDIRLLGFNNYGDISFDVRGTRYVFNTDAGRFRNGVLARMLRYQPGKAFNELLLLVKSGAAEQLSPLPKTKPEIQKRLF